MRDFAQKLPLPMLKHLKRIKKRESQVDGKGIDSF